MAWFFIATLLLFTEVAQVFSLLNRWNVINSMAKDRITGSCTLRRKVFQETSVSDISLQNNTQLPSDTPQILHFIEPNTNVEVILIGSMHYNPQSIKLTKDTIATYAESGLLKSVLIESCDIRWNQTVKNDESMFSLLKNRIFYNEMLAAGDVAKMYKIPLILGDQRINDTLSALKTSCLSTIKDVLTPIGGWRKLINDVGWLAKVVLPTGDGYLGPRDFFEWKLLLNAPIAFIKYPLAIVVKSPSVGIPISLLLFWFFFHIEESKAMLLAFDNTNIGSSEVAYSEITNVLSEALFSFSFYLIQFSFIGRGMLGVLLHERNKFIAEKIKQQCEEAAKDNTNKKIVIAVLGMAHCNGIKKIMTTPH